MTHKTRSLFALLLALVLLLSGCAQIEALLNPKEEDPGPQPLIFSKAGSSITLTDAFVQKEHLTYTMSFESAHIAVMALKEEFTLFEHTDYSAESTLEEYAGLVWSANSMEGSPALVNADGLTYFDYDRSANGNDYTVRTYVFKADDGFWMYQFTTLAQNFDELTAQITEYANTITFES